MRFLCLLLLICFLIIGCSAKKAGFEGKVADGKGQALSGVRVIAKQVQPVAGYEQFEATTDSAGMFHFDKVLPNSDYALSFTTDNWKTEKKVVVRSGPEGQTYILPSPVVIRYMISNDSVITDSKTGMQWTPSPEYTFSWDGAKNYAQNLKLRGYSDWRLPTKAELHELYDASLKDEINSTFHISRNSRVWSSEFHDPKAAWRMDLKDGTEDFIFRGNSMGDMAMVAVHPPK